MSSYNYISSTDLTATVATGFNLSGYIADANNHIEYMALSFGLQPEDISTPVHFLIKEYAVAYAYRAMYKDKIGTNNVELTQDKYLVLYDLQNKEVERIRPYLTQEIFTGNASSPNEVSRTTIVFRN